MKHYFKEALHLIDLSFKEIQEMQPTLIAQTSDGEVLAVPLAFLPDDHRIKAAIIGVIGQKLAKETPKIVQIHLITEAWVAKYDKIEDHVPRPSGMPNRQEVVMIASYSIKGEKNIVAFSMKRNGKEVKRGKKFDMGTPEDCEMNILKPFWKEYVNAVTPGK